MRTRRGIADEPRRMLADCPSVHFGHEGSMARILHGSPQIDFTSFVVQMDQRTIVKHPKWFARNPATSPLRGRLNNPLRQGPLR